MGWLGRIGRQRYEKEGDDRPVPQGGMKRYLFLLGTHFGKLVALNLLFIACSLPILTLPISLCALNRVCINLVREGRCFLLEDFFEEWKGSFLKSLPLGLLIFGGMFGGSCLIRLGMTNAQSVYALLFSALGIAAILLLALLGSWTFALVAMLPLPCRDLLKDAGILLALEWKRDLLMLGVLLLAACVALLLFPLSLIPLVLILISFVQYTLCFIINTPVQERIIAPYEAKRKTEEANQA